MPCLSPWLDNDEWKEWRKVLGRCRVRIRKEYLGSRLKSIAQQLKKKAGSPLAVSVKSSFSVGSELGNTHAELGENNNKEM